MHCRLPLALCKVYILGQCLLSYLPAQQMPSITFVFLMSEWRMWDSTVFLLVLIHKTMKGQPRHKVENTTASWTTMAESTGFLLVILQSQLIVKFNSKLFFLGQGTISVPLISPVRFFANCEIWSDDLRPDVFVLQAGGYPGHNSTELWFPPSYNNNRRSFSSSSTTPCNLTDLPKPIYYPTARLNVKHIWQLSFAGALKYLFWGAGK